MPALDTLSLYIDGTFCQAASRETFESINPYTTKAWVKIPRCNAHDVDRAVSAAHQAFTKGTWPALPASARGALLRKLADKLTERAEFLAKIETQDNGKLIAEMSLQLKYLPQFFYYYAGIADKLEGRVISADTPNHFNFTRREPLGVVAAITPWNSPLLLTAMKVAPALAAGNTLVLKPSEHASASTLEFIKLFDEVGFPPGVINVVTGYGADVGAPLVEHDLVAKVAFTGGEAGGRAVYQAAAKDFKHVTLELGGKSPNVVFSDANVDKAVNGTIAGIFAASGQTCIAGSRLLVHRNLHDEMVEKLIAIARQAQMGNPMLLETQVGPVTTKQQQETILSYLNIAKSEGATCALGGHAGEGWFVEPTILTGVNNKMRIAQEEVFGPVLSVIPFDDDEEAVAIANDTLYGLAAGIWTESMSRALNVSATIQAGTVWVNTYRAFSAQAPFGGYKHSGLGRENGVEAIEEYLQTKSVWISTTEDIPANPFVMKI